MFEGYGNHFDESVRLSILQILAEQNDFTLPDSMVEDLLVSRYLVNKGRGYVRSQMRWLQSQVEAIAIEETHTDLVVTLLGPGKDHLRMRSVLEGVRRPNAPRRL